jgi:hypothetical protein
MKKLSKNEMEVLSNVIVSKINEKKVKEVEGKLGKDVDFKRLKKLSEEMNEMNKKLSVLNKNYNEVCLKVRNKFDISSIWRDSNNSDLKINFNNNNINNVKIYNDLVLNSIGNDFNVDELVNKIVEKYS